MKYFFKTTKEDNNQRIDVYLSKKICKLSRSQIQKLIKEKDITVNNQTVKPNYKLTEGETIEVVLPKPKKLEVSSEKILLNILYEDKDIIVVDKPQGMVVHPAPGNYSGTLVNALLYHCKDLSGINGVLRPGIVHRIDKDTSGVIVVAKNDESHLKLAKQIKEHTVKRVYKALVFGNIEQQTGIIKTTIGRHPIDRKKMAVNVKNAKEAETHFTVLERFGEYTFVEFILKTGRTHQIRVHSAYIKHPVVGDPKYTSGKNIFGFKGQALHAAILGFLHPSTEKYMEFEAPLPDYMIRALDMLRRNQIIN